MKNDVVVVRFGTERMTAFAFSALGKHANDDKQIFIKGGGPLEKKRSLELSPAEAAVLRTVVKDEAPSTYVTIALLCLFAAMLHQHNKKNSF